MGRGTMRSMVEGWFDADAAGSRENLLLPANYPFTTFGGPPPHRFAIGRQRARRRDLNLHMHAFATLYRLLSPARRRQFVLTLLLMLVGAGAEMVTIGAALPFLALVADPHSALIPPRLLALLAMAGGSPVAGAALLLVAAALGSAAIRLGLTWGSQRFVMATGHDMAAAVFGRMLRQPY